MVSKIREKIEKGNNPYELWLKLIKKRLTYPLLIFVSEIELGQQLFFFKENIKKYFPKEKK